MGGLTVRLSLLDCVSSRAARHPSALRVFARRRASTMLQCAMRPTLLLAAIAWLAVTTPCIAVADAIPAAPKPASSLQLRNYLVSHKADLEQFRSRGPFAAAMQPNRELSLSASERIAGDLFLSLGAGKAPLVIFIHGNGSSKEAHTRQAMHLASWGMHCLAVQMPGDGRWTSKGTTLARIVEFIHEHPQAIDAPIDVDKIVLVGHSYGASSVAVALAEGAQATGAILLDPAGTGRELPKYLRQIGVPVMILGADEEVFAAIRRDDFFHLIRAGVSEVSVRNATHADAQFPARAATHSFGIETNEDLQITFASALTAAALSLAADRTFDYAWASFAGNIRDGTLINPRRK